MDQLQIKHPMDKGNTENLAHYLEVSSAGCYQLHQKRARLDTEGLPMWGGVG